MPDKEGFNSNENHFFKESFLTHSINYRYQFLLESDLLLRRSF